LDEIVRTFGQKEGRPEAAFWIVIIGAGDRSSRIGISRS
jgi:hypothetical protein